MITDDIKKFLGRDWISVCDGMQRYLNTDIQLLSATNDRLLSQSGKQIRPLVSLLMARACGGCANENSIRFAIAAELIHNATLLHDDVADKSDLRRGKPTVRALMGPEASVLVGDFWLVKAISAILDAEHGNGRVISIFATTMSDLAEGEMLQLEKASSCDTTREDYLRIIYDKTASLFASATTCAAISAGADTGKERLATEYGRCLGLAFQIRDDILDYLPACNAGKPTGVDVMEGKMTLPLLCALDNAGGQEKSRIMSAIRSENREERNEIISFVRENGGIEGAQAVLEDYSSRAVQALDGFPMSDDRRWLEKTASLLATRTN